MSVYLSTICPLSITGILSGRGGGLPISELQGRDLQWSGIDIPDGYIFKHSNLLTFKHFRPLGQSMSDLKVAVSKGKTVATLLVTEFPPLSGERLQN